MEIEATGVQYEHTVTRKNPGELEGCKGTASRCGSWKAEVAMSFVNYSIIIENGHPFPPKSNFSPFLEKKLIKSHFSVFLGRVYD